MIKVIVDAFGGDNSPHEIVKGAVQAVNGNPEIHVVLCGKQDVIGEILKNHKYNDSQISILNATEVIDNNESPTVAIKQKKDSSLVVAYEEAKQNDEIAGLVSAGSTGAVLTGAFLKLGRMTGVQRPALCPNLPTVTGGTVCLCDCGANMDCSSDYLVQFAIMGNAYLKVLGVDSPRVALLNVGTEDHKGDTLRKATFEELSKLQNINFVGNMESRDTLSGQFDLVVTDGFAGNVLLKSIEGTASSILKSLKKAIKSSIVSTFGALFMKKAFRTMKDNFDHEKHGGAVLLGCKKLVIKAHGSSKCGSIKQSINQIYTMATGNLIEKIGQNLKDAGLGKDE